MKLSTPVSTIILVGNVPPHFQVTATKSANGLKRGQVYVPLAVNHQGNLAVAALDDLQNPVVGPKGQWHPMMDFDVYYNPSADNDN